MSPFAAARCQHIKVSGIQCGSPALRNKAFCFYHQQTRPLAVECYAEQEYSTGEIDLPPFEDAHSVQYVLRQVVQMVMQKRIERKTASLLLYALQIASSNLKRMDLEKPQPEQVVIDPETVSQTPMEPTNHDQEASEVNASPQANRDAKQDAAIDGDDLPLGTIHACYQPGPKMRNRQSQSRQQNKNDKAGNRGKAGRRDVSRDVPRKEPSVVGLSSPGFSLPCFGGSVCESNPPTNVKQKA
jgi:hypothetical protein